MLELNDETALLVGNSLVFSLARSLSLSRSRPYLYFFVSRDDTVVAHSSQEEFSWILTDVRVPFVNALLLNVYIFYILFYLLFNIVLPHKKYRRKQERGKGGLSRGENEIVGKRERGKKIKSQENIRI